MALHVHPVDPSVLFDPATSRLLELTLSLIAQIHCFGHRSYARSGTDLALVDALELYSIPLCVHPFKMSAETASVPALAHRLPTAFHQSRGAKRWLVPTGARLMASPRVGIRTPSMCAAEPCQGD